MPSAGLVKTLALTLLCALPLSCSDAGGAVGRSQTQASGPSVEVVDLAGIDAALAQHRGRGVLLNFWAIWCAPCVEELPELMEVAREFAADGGRVVLVSYDLMIPGAEREAGAAEVTSFAQKRGLNVPILVYDAPDLEAINARFDLPGGIPVTLAIDANGKIVDKQDGQAGKARFQEMMRTALGL